MPLIKTLRITLFLLIVHLLAWSINFSFIGGSPESAFSYFIMAWSFSAGEIPALVWLYSWPVFIVLITAYSLAHKFFDKKSKSQLLLLGVVWACITLNPPAVDAQESLDPSDFGIPKEIWNEYQARTKRIEEELSRPQKNNEWVGKYYYGDHTGTNVTLAFARESGFTYIFTGCLGIYGLGYGNTEWSDGRLKLLFESADDQGFASIEREYIAVRWGRRHYLITPDEMIRFSNAVNAGLEPCFGFDCGGFLLKQEDKNKKVRGKPDIPAEYRLYLLQKPVKAQIQSVIESRIERSKIMPEHQDRVTNITLDVGGNKGIKPGMELYVYNPTTFFEKATITKVEEQSSEAEIVQFGLEGEAPSIGWKLSTRHEGLR
jgi:hypothetical protein